jgi:carboxyl-terminal processing protease
MVVIVNEDSYSAAEFFAAALQEYGKAQIIGTQTFGKGYSQIGIEVGDGSLINLSTNEYFTPQGKSLIGVGVVPDHVVPFEGDTDWQLLDPENDNQIQYALSLFS